jgi:acetyl esterase/lipase
VYPLLIPGVLVPELSPLLAVLPLILGGIALRRGFRRNRVVIGLSIASIALLLAPGIEAILAHQRFDAATASLPPAVTGRENESVRVTRGIVFAEPDGQALTIDLYRSARETALPVVIQIYGGAWRQGEPANQAAFATALARRGYLVAAIDYRHAPKAQWPAQINDVRLAVEWVVAHAGEYGGDPRLMAVLGRSAGAQLALVAAYTDPARFSAVVSLYGPTDLADGWRSPPWPDPLPVRPPLEDFLGGTPDTVPQRYEAASPLTYVARRVPATLLVYGGRDHIVEPRFGRELHDRLKRVGATSIYLELPWAEHAFDLVPGLSARIVQPYIERFLAAYLQ